MAALGEIPDRDFLRNPPSALEVEQRITYGILYATTRMAELAFLDLSKAACHYAEAGVAFPEDDSDARLRIHNLAWSIVDQCDLLRSTIVSEGDRIDLRAARSFLIAAAPVNEVRRLMRHIDKGVGNYAKRRQGLPPALGALSFTVPKRLIAGAKLDGVVDDCDIVEFETIVLLSTALEREVKLEGAPEAYVAFPVPVGNFFLQAYGKAVSLDRTVAAMSKFCDEMAERAAAAFQHKSDELKAAGDWKPENERPAFERRGTFRMTGKRD